MNLKGERFDIIISGGSFTGLALARALSNALGPRARVAIIEKSVDSPTNAAPNPRAFALSKSAQQMLNVLGACQLIENEAQPVLNIEITDSSLEAGIRPVVLRYNNTLDDGAPASYIIPDQTLGNALRTMVNQTPNIEFIAPAMIEQVEHETGFASVLLDNGRNLRTKLLVATEGRKSRLREKAGIKLVSWDYRQDGIVTQIAHEHSHNATAIQHFLPGGPFAILPMKKNRSCITWSEERTKAQELMNSDDATFLENIEMRVGGRLGKLTLDGPRQSWPLSMHLARSFIAERLALVGDTAHGVHPIAGQGLNLGLRDVAALTQVTAETWRLGLDIGANDGNGDGLSRYQRWRRFDSMMSTAAFDGLNRLFSNDKSLLRSLRTAGLGIVDRLPQLKHMFITEAAGLSGNVPRLLKGKAV